jgi:DNA-directed RNA polymerase subunit RPC12/RpoP
MLNFKQEKDKIQFYKNKLLDIKSSLELKNIRQRVINTLLESEKNLSDYINDIENDISLNFYITDTAFLLEKYTDILNKPIKVNFMGKAVKNNKEKNNIVQQYLEIAQKYVDIELNVKENSTDKKDKIVCKNCNNKKDFENFDSNIYICMHCSAQQLILKNISSYRDIDRVNISTKYCYDRKIHFRDCINQYQGKQNSTIDASVYEELEKQFELHHLLQGDKSTPKSIRFDNITKEHIGMFLKELEYTKHYENINLIHYNMTGKKPDDIGYLEDKLLDDFDIIVDLYDKLFKHINRKNFINTQYILFQMLKRYKHPCNPDDFTILKTIDRKTFHDDIFRELATKLEWSFTPTF